MVWMAGKDDFPGEAMDRQDSRMADVLINGDSIMNGVQTLPYWIKYFHNPSGAQLSLFNSTQGSLVFAAVH
jgi:hypothetical protein